MSRVVKTATGGDRMKATDAYKERLAEWIRSESEVCGSPEKLAARISLPDYDVTGAHLRKLALPLDNPVSIKKELGLNLVYPMAAYAKRSPEEFTQWLRTGHWTPYGPAKITLRAIQSISEIEHIAEVQRWLADRLLEVLDILADLSCPETDEAFREAIAVHSQLIEARRSIPRQRIMDVAAGGLPTLDELAQLSRYFIGEEDANLTKLLALYPDIKPKQKTAGNTEAPPGGRRTRAQSPPGRARSPG